MQRDPLEWKIRRMEKKDHKFVGKSFTRTAGMDLPAGACWKCLRRELEGVLGDTSSTCMVAVCLMEDPDNPQDGDVLGFAVGYSNSLFYVYVRETYWGQGMGSALLQSMNLKGEFIRFTNISEKGHALLRSVERRRGIRFAYCR
jgi:GNAT superfamily N-acetyltransferase